MPLYKKRTNIEDILASFPLNELKIMRYGYIPGTSNYRVQVKSQQKIHTFIFNRCIEVHQSQNHEDEVPPSIPASFERESDKIRPLNKWYYVEFSHRAAEWNLRLPTQFHEIKLFIGHTVISLVFESLSYKQVSDVEKHLQPV